MIRFNKFHIPVLLFFKHMKSDLVRTTFDEISKGSIFVAITQKCHSGYLVSSLHNIFSSKRKVMCVQWAFCSIHNRIWHLP